MENCRATRQDVALVGMLLAGIGFILFMAHEAGMSNTRKGIVEHCKTDHIFVHEDMIFMCAEVMANRRET